ncbi:hypothetical protein [Clostridium estertheticum]|uniref:Uncharacterized protein n=1 Tax=Clostridium estertheticum TaxID=238834 RepID=A0A5N7IN19_9CLOT|nr:hypothetical protein [Clostridium estertheticum]MCB2343282.1 hypothetical protein [Clostridium estertheticum]MPQ31652.1 hypothetical protein [Clostridium estertheticum]MPQ62316.1 hypothetical protein [Clostridium estertheticum]
MLKKIGRKILAVLIIIIITILFNKCSNSHKPRSRLNEIKPLSVTVEGVEFKVGQSKLGAVLDGGLLISSNTSLEKDTNGLQLEKMTYYLAVINKDGYNLGQVNFVNNTEQSIGYRDCIISEYEMNFEKAEAGIKKNKYDNILIDGVNFKGKTINDVKNIMSKKTEDVDEILQPDGSIGILSYEIENISVSISFDYTTKIVSKVNIYVPNTYFE